MDNPGPSSFPWPIQMMLENG